MTEQQKPQQAELADQTVQAIKLCVSRALSKFEGEVLDGSTLNLAAERANGYLGDLFSDHIYGRPHTTIEGCTAEDLEVSVHWHRNGQATTKSVSFRYSNLPSWAAINHDLNLTGRALFDNMNDRLTDLITDRLTNMDAPVTADGLQSTLNQIQWAGHRINFQLEGRNSRIWSICVLNVNTPHVHFKGPNRLSIPIVIQLFTDCYHQEMALTYSVSSIDPTPTITQPNNYDNFYEEALK